MNKIDLHIHTNHSLDAEFSPKQIVKMAKEAGLHMIAIADHDTTSAVKEAKEKAKMLDIKVIPAIEISCDYKGIELHILAYGIDVSNPKYAEIFKNIRRQEREASKKRLQLIEEMGIFVNTDKLNKLIIDGVIFAEIIGEASINESQNKDNPLIKPFLKNRHLSDNPYVNFYWEFCSQGKPAHVPTKLPSLKEVIKIIKDDHALAIFAHPGNNIKENEKLLHEIMDKGLDGLEAYSSYHNHKQTEFYINKAEENNWLITCGSDFHGKNKPAVKLADINIKKHHEESLFKQMHLLNS